MESHELQIERAWLYTGEGHWEMILTCRDLPFVVQIYGGPSVGMNWWALVFSEYPEGMSVPNEGGRHATREEALALAEREVRRVVAVRARS
jgi:hypothetical protein